MDEAKITISLNGEFTATELEEIIRDLAMARADLTPPVATAPPTTAAEDDLLVRQQESLIVRTLDNGGLRFWFRHPGFGWIGCSVGERWRIGFREFIDKRLAHSYTSH